MFQQCFVFVQPYHTPPQTQFPTQRGPAADTGTGELWQGVLQLCLVSEHALPLFAHGVSHPCVGAKPQLLVGQGAWHRAGCTLAQEAMPDEGLGEMNRLHIHGRVC